MSDTMQAIKATGDNAATERGAEARRKLIAAALDVFGEQGFDGASTREIARRAGVNLAAIPYYFASKEGLHRAVAQQIVNEISGRLGEKFSAIEAAMSQGSMDSATARQMLHRMLDAASEVILGHPEAGRWAPFILREQMSPGISFDILYDGFMGRAVATITMLYSLAAGRDSRSEETAVRVLGVIGQLLVFRMGRAVIGRHLGWAEYGDEQVSMVRDMLHEHMDALIDTQISR